MSSVAIGAAAGSGVGHIARGGRTRTLAEAGTIGSALSYAKSVSQGQSAISSVSAIGAAHATVKRVFANAVVGRLARVGTGAGSSAVVQWHCGYCGGSRKRQKV